MSFCFSQTIIEFHYLKAVKQSKTYPGSFRDLTSWFILRRKVIFLPKARRFRTLSLCFLNPITYLIFFSTQNLHITLPASQAGRMQTAVGRNSYSSTATFLSNVMVVVCNANHEKNAVSAVDS